MEASVIASTNGCEHVYSEPAPFRSTSSSASSAGRPVNTVYSAELWWGTPRLRLASFAVSLASSHSTTSALYLARRAASTSTSVTAMRPPSGDAEDPLQLVRYLVDGSPERGLFFVVETLELPLHE